MIKLLKNNIKIITNMEVNKKESDNEILDNV